MFRSLREAREVVRYMDGHPEEMEEIDAENFELWQASSFLVKLSHVFNDPETKQNLADHLMGGVLHILGVLSYGFIDLPRQWREVEQSIKELSDDEELV